MAVRMVAHLAVLTVVLMADWRAALKVVLTVVHSADVTADWMADR